MRRCLKEEDRYEIVAYNESYFYLMVRWEGSLFPVGYGSAEGCWASESWWNPDPERKFEKIYSGNSYQESVDALWENRTKYSAHGEVN